MMTKMATVSSEGIERISSSLGNMARERRLPSAGSTRKETLLGLDPGPQADWNDLNELREEDVWGDDFLIPEGRKDDVFNPAFKEKTDSFDTLRSFSNQRRWLGVEMETTGLSMALGDTGRSRGFQAISSPHNRGSPGALLGHGASREGTAAGRLSSTSRMIVQRGSTVEYARQTAAQSAPMEVPDWSSVLGEETKKEVYAEEEEEEGERLPPHELVARSQATTFSVFEGVGRTLKGRDLSRVRNAVWRQTGFID